jgi:DNA-binding transcriptional ArsR family regulator
MLVLISGFGAGFFKAIGGGAPGIHKMGASSRIGGKVKGSKHLFDWDATSICETIQIGVKEDPCEPVVVIGHSLGGDTAAEVCEELKAKGICVDLLIQMESVGTWDDEKPSNVRQGVNIFSVGLDAPDGEEWIDGSINIGIKGTDHTGIDDSDDAGKVTPSGQDYDNMTSWDVVEHFVDKLPEKGCNCDQGSGGFLLYDLFEMFGTFMPLLLNNIGQTYEELIEIIEGIDPGEILKNLARLYKAGLVDVEIQEDMKPKYKVSEKGAELGKSMPKSGGTTPGTNKNQKPKAEKKKKP